MTDYPQGPVETVEAGPVPQQMAPHRGTLILVLGILGIVCCIICGIVVILAVLSLVGWLLMMMLAAGTGAMNM